MVKPGRAQFGHVKILTAFTSHQIKNVLQLILQSSYIKSFGNFTLFLTRDSLKTKTKNYLPRLALLVTSYATGSGLMARDHQQMTHFGVRPLGMGNAYVSIADDFNSIFYNPAGMAFLDGVHGGLLLARVEIAKNTTDFISDAQKLSKGSGGDTDAVLDMIEKQSGKAQSLGLGITPHFIWKGFGIGAGISLAGTFVFRSYPTIDLDVGPRVVIPIGYARKFLQDTVAVGATVKLRARGGINKEFSLQDLEALSANKNSSDGPKLSDYVEGGLGTGVDFGFLFKPGTVLDPRLGLSILDIGDTPYKKMKVQKQATKAPEIHRSSVNVGMSFLPVDQGWLKWRLSMDTHGINQSESFSRKLNLGSEVSMTDWFKIQTGFYQGYVTGGFQIDIPMFELRAITYAEELGETAGSIQDRRYALELKVLI